MENSGRDIDNYFLVDKLLAGAGSPQLDNPILFPLYLSGSTTNSHPNINPESLLRTRPFNLGIAHKIADYTGLGYTGGADELAQENASPVCYALSSEIREEFKIPTVKTTFSPVDILDYSYAVLHLPSDDKKHRNFLKTSSLRVPYPKNAAEFWVLAEIGRKIRQIHFSQSSKVAQVPSYPEGGNNIIVKSFRGFVLTDKEHALGKIWINNHQYFDKVPLAAWDFYIGGVFPAREWLSARQGSILAAEDISHYQRMIAVLSETGRFIQKIEKIGTTDH